MASGLKHPALLEAQAAELSCQLRIYNSTGVGLGVDLRSAIGMLQFCCAGRTANIGWRLAAKRAWPVRGQLEAGPGWAAGLAPTPQVIEQGVLQVTISLPPSEGAGSEQGSILHAMVPSRATAAQLLQVQHLLEECPLTQ